ncbi:MAG: FliA/WhiG family RNA polymerase sigma factor [Planctomycetota bacterium]|nr:MAG: FliA/WhiG family RNA polymerase sigma factor [Planctomycetota bacterium]
MNPVKLNYEEWLKKDQKGFWNEFHRTKNLEMRNFLIEKYLHLVKYHAQRLGAKLHDKLDWDDLEQAGVFGLIQAIENFDPQRGNKFETYCALRIRGAILDDIRSHDWVPRLVRQKAKAWQEAFQTLEEKLGREPSEKEMADYLKLSLADFRKMTQEASTVSMFSLNSKDKDEESQGLNEVISDPKSSSPLEKVEKKDLIQTMIQNLSYEEKLVIQMYYYDGLTMKEIGVALGLSESRVCQIHGYLIKRLKTKYSSQIRKIAA